MRYVCWKMAIATGLYFVLSAASAYANPTYTLEGVDITPAVQYYSTHVMPLTKPISVYNWGHHGPNKYWDKEPVQGEPSLIQMAKNETHSFWGNYGNLMGAGNMYGYGLYASVDPVATWGYGGGNISYCGSYNSTSSCQPDWLLFEMNLPVGFKLIDFTYSSVLSGLGIPQDVQDVTGKFDCVASDVNTFFMMGGTTITAHCQKLVKEIFYKDLKIDGFAYNYGSTKFKECTGDQEYKFSKAFVLVSDSWVTPTDVKFYTSLSTKDVDARTRIQTLFLKAYEDTLINGSTMTQSISNELQSFLMELPDSVVEGSTTTCSGPTCVISVHLCDPNNNCIDRNLTPLPRQGGPNITAAEAASAGSGLWWPDLDGKPKSTDVTTWLKNNKYGCTGEPPFDVPKVLLDKMQ